MAIISSKRVLLWRACHAIKLLHEALAILNSSRVVLAVFETFTEVLLYLYLFDMYSTIISAPRFCASQQYWGNNPSTTIQIKSYCVTEPRFCA